MGNLPVTLTLRPDDEPPNDGNAAAVRLRAQIVSDSTDAGYDGNLVVTAPDGWVATPRSEPVTVKAGGHLSVPITVTAPAAAAPGWYAVAASINHQGQDLQDVLIVPVGRPAPEPLLRARSEAQQLTLTPGTRSRVRVQVAHTLRTPLRGHVELITPHHIWPLMSNPTRSFTIEAGSTASVEFDVAVPAATPPGEFWAQPKICAYGHITYAEPVRIIIRPGEGDGVAGRLDRPAPAS